MQGAHGGKDASWVDYFSLSQLPAPSRALGKLCTAPSGVAAADATVQLLPGVDILDLYGTSEKAEIWKDGQTSPCWVPRQVSGWEFYGLLWPKPDGASQLRLSSTIDLLIGRPPGDRVCPSLVFAYVPASHTYAGNLPSQPSKAPQQGGRTPVSYERLCGNLDLGGRTVTPRLVVLCPSVVYKDATKLPDEQNWGLFIGPRSRSLVLLNNKNGRVDLNLATLLAMDSAFRLGRDFINAIARLFEPFGCQHQVPALLAGKFDPMRVHSGLTGTLVVDHVNISLDGREDYWRVFGIRLPTFFLSNASSNLRFFTPSEAQHLRAGIDPSAPLPPSEPLPDMPLWTLLGPFASHQQSALHSYRERMPVSKVTQDPSVGDGILQFLGLDSAPGGSSVWPFPSLAGCADISLGGAADASTVASTPCGYSARACGSGDVSPKEGHYGHGWGPRLGAVADVQGQGGAAHPPVGVTIAPGGQHSWGPARPDVAVPKSLANAGWTTADGQPSGDLVRGPMRGHWPSSGPPTPQPIEH